MNWIEIGFRALELGLVGWFVTRMTRHIDQYGEDMKLVHLRGDVTDRAVSDIVGAAFDSYKIAKRESPFPKIKRKPRES